MGIVVSGEELNTASMREQEKIALLAEENDFGLALAAIDQLSMFGASWWTKSLACRIQVNIHIPLIPSPPPFRLLTSFIDLQKLQCRFFNRYSFRRTSTNWLCRLLFRGASRLDRIFFTICLPITLLRVGVRLSSFNPFLPY